MPGTLMYSYQKFDLIYLLKNVLDFLGKYFCICGWDGVNATLHTWRPKGSLTVLILGIRLTLSGLGDKCPYLLNHFTSPEILNLRLFLRMLFILF